MECDPVRLGLHVVPRAEEQRSNLLLECPRLLSTSKVGNRRQQGRGSRLGEGWRLVLLRFNHQPVLFSKKEGLQRLVDQRYHCRSAEMASCLKRGTQTAGLRLRSELEAADGLQESRESTA